MKISISLVLILSFLSFNSFANLLSNAIPYPFYDVHKESEGKYNDIMLLDHGAASFQKRIEIIREAQTNIEVEYFIYSVDKSSRILTQELVAAAQRGVKVRMLIDKSIAVFVFDEYYAQALREKGVEVKYYNASPLIKLSSIQFRNHRKLISVDDKIAITGGRNIGDEYFDLSKSFNFIDRDILVNGPIVKTMRDSFDEYYKSDIVETPKQMLTPPKMVKKRVKERGSAVYIRKYVDNSKAINRYNEIMAKTRDFITRNQEDTFLLDKFESIGKEIINKSKIYSCPELTYSTDRSGGSYKKRVRKNYSRDYRYLRKTLHDKINQVDKGIILSSPYLINNTQSKKLMDTIFKRDLELVAYTNSLASTDAIYVAANLYSDITKWTKQGLELYLHDGTYSQMGPVIEPAVKKAKWGTHSKTHIYNYHNEHDSEVMIGTYNIDNRSNYYNSEMAIFCQGNIEFTKDVTQSIQNRMKDGFVVHSDYTATDKHGNIVNVYGADESNVLLMKLISLPSWLLKPLL